MQRIFEWTHKFTGFTGHLLAQMFQSNDPPNDYFHPLCRLFFCFHQWFRWFSRPLSFALFGIFKQIVFMLHIKRISNVHEDRENKIKITSLKYRLKLTFFFLWFHFVVFWSRLRKIKNMSERKQIQIFDLDFMLRRKKNDNHVIKRSTKLDRCIYEIAREKKYRFKIESHRIRCNNK